jgi:hypothetical protein
MGGNDAEIACIATFACFRFLRRYRPRSVTSLWASSAGAVTGEGERRDGYRVGRKVAQPAVLGV